MRLASSVCVLAAAIGAGGCGTDVDLGGAVDAGGDAGALVDAGANDGGVVVDAPADVPDLPDLTPFPDGTWTMTIAPRWVLRGSAQLSHGRPTSVATRAPIGT